MAGNIHKVSGVPLIAQRGTGVCWCASAIMLYKWAQSAGKTTMKNPLSDTGTKWRWDNNKDWDPADNAKLCTLLSMTSHTSIPAEYAALKTFFDAHGPIWTAGKKTWGEVGVEPYGHVVVLAGVADTGVWVLDPEPVNQGQSFWFTWTQIKKYTDGTAALVKYLTAI